MCSNQNELSFFKLDVQAFFQTEKQMQRAETSPRLQQHLFHSSVEVTGMIQPAVRDLCGHIND